MILKKRSKRRIGVIEFYDDPKYYNIGDTIKIEIKGGKVIYKLVKIKKEKNYL